MATEHMPSDNDNPTAVFGNVKSRLKIIKQYTAMLNLLFLLKLTFSSCESGLLLSSMGDNKKTKIPDIPKEAMASAVNQSVGMRKIISKNSAYVNINNKKHRNCVLA